jgi:hypothetical protein
MKLQFCFVNEKREDYFYQYRIPGGAEIFRPIIEKIDFAKRPTCIYQKKAFVVVVVVVFLLL